MHGVVTRYVAATCTCLSILRVFTGLPKGMLTSTTSNCVCKFCRFSYKKQAKKQTIKRSCCCPFFSARRTLWITAIIARYFTWSVLCLNISIHQEMVEGKGGEGTDSRLNEPPRWLLYMYPFLYAVGTFNLCCTENIFLFLFLFLFLSFFFFFVFFFFFCAVSPRRRLVCTPSSSSCTFLIFAYCLPACLCVITFIFLSFCILFRRPSVGWTVTADEMETLNRGGFFLFFLFLILM